MSKSKKRRNRIRRQTHIRRKDDRVFYPPRIDDYVFEFPDEEQNVSVCQLMDQGIPGLRRLTELLPEWENHDDYPVMALCVCEEMIDRISELIFMRSADETMRDAVAVILRLIELLPMMTESAKEIANEMGFRDRTELVRDASDEQIEMTVMHIYDLALTLAMAFVRGRDEGLPYEGSDDDE